MSQKHIKKLEKLEIFVSRGFPPPYFEKYVCWVALNWIDKNISGVIYVRAHISNQTQSIIHPTMVLYWFLNPFRNQYKNKQHIIEGPINV